MKCAPFCALSLNSTPLLARIATGMPQMCAKPQTSDGAVERLELVELGLPSTSRAITSCTS